MVRIAVMLLFAAIGVVAALWIAGTLLPVAHEASRSATFGTSPERLYQVIADRDRYREWWDDDTPTVVVDSAPPQRMVTRISEGLPFGGTWTFEVAPDSAGSRLTITERGEVYNPLFRVLSRYVFGHTATMDRYLRALALRVEATTAR